MLRQHKQVQYAPSAKKILSLPAKYCSVEREFATEWKRASRERVTGLEDCLSDKLVVLVTCASAAQARRIARAVVEARLAACVNILPGAVTSIYR